MIISEKNKIVIFTRIKSFLWRTGMIALVAGINFLASNLELFNLPVEVVGIIGLVLGEISKQINNSLSGK